MAHIRKFYKRDLRNGKLTFLGELAVDNPGGYTGGSGGNEQGYGMTLPPPPPPPPVSGPLYSSDLPVVTEPSAPFDPTVSPLSSQLQQMGMLQNLQNSLNQDIEVVVPLNHWEQRTVVSGTTLTFRTPIFDLWWDHIKEEAGVVGGVVTGAGGSTPAAGSSIIQGIQWGNHRFEYTCKIITGSLTFLTGSVTMFCGMNMTGSDEPLQVSTMNILADINKTDRSVFITGRVPMRFVQFRWTLTLDAPGADVDLMHQISVRST